MTAEEIEILHLQGVAGASEIVCTEPIHASPGAAELIDSSDHLQLLVETELSTLVFRRRGWTREQHANWSRRILASGTAAGVTFFESLTHKGNEVVIGDGKIGEFSAYALKTLKGIQYGLIEDKYGWMVSV